jgi:hypothetical protein
MNCVRTKGWFRTTLRRWTRWWSCLFTASYWNFPILLSHTAIILIFQNENDFQKSLMTFTLQFCSVKRTIRGAQRVSATTCMLFFEVLKIIVVYLRHIFSATPTGANKANRRGKGCQGNRSYFPGSRRKKTSIPCEAHSNDVFAEALSASLIKNDRYRPSFLLRESFDKKDRKELFGNASAAADSKVVKSVESCRSTLEVGSADFQCRHHHQCPGKKYGELDASAEFNFFYPPSAGRGRS